MQKLFFLLLLGFTFLGVNAQSNPAEQVAHKIADKMRDTLVLTDAQRGQLYGINMRLHQQKMQARQQHGNDQDVVGKALQQVENTRDSLYKEVLTEQQYVLYQQKKRNLVSIN